MKTNIVCQFVGHDYRKSSREDYYHHYKYVCQRKDCVGHTDFSTDDKWRNTFWDSGVWETIKYIGMALLCAILVLSLVVLLINFLGVKTCQQYAKMGVETSYNFWTGCMANHSKFGWVPVDEYFRVINLNIP